MMIHFPIDPITDEDGYCKCGRYVFLMNGDFVDNDGEVWCE